MEREGNRIRAQVQEECEEIKRIAFEEAETVRSQARAEAMKTREGADLYAEKVLTRLEAQLAEQQQEVKNGQIYLEKMRKDALGAYDAQSSRQVSF